MNNVTARKVLDSGGLFAELKVGILRLQLTPAEAAEVVLELMKIPEIQQAYRRLEIQQAYRRPKVRIVPSSELDPKKGFRARDYIEDPK